jgi:hypothetical protein
MLFSEGEIMKKIVVILPDLPQKSYLKPIADSLSFLAEDYQFDYIDPCELSFARDCEVFYEDCRHWLKNVMTDYSAFFGFSFGGAILQQCFPLFKQNDKPIILFSAPGVVDKSLRDKLSQTIKLCEEQRLNDALTALYKHVFFPSEDAPTAFVVDDEKEATKRILFGLQHVLETDASIVLQNTDVNYLHFIGEHSQLVNHKNVAMGQRGRLIQVPNAGMRVLQNNLAFCKDIILEALDE